MTATQFHSEYEIVKWLASRDNFDRGLAELREALANGTIVNGRGLVQKWLAVYDDVTTGRVVESPLPPAPAPVAAITKPVEAIRVRDEEALAMERTLLQRTTQEARLWAEAAQEAAARADAKAELFEAQTRYADRDSRSGVGLATLALALVALLILLLWPQLETRALALWSLLSP